MRNAACSRSTSWSTATPASPARETTAAKPGVLQLTGRAAHPPDPDFAAPDGRRPQRASGDRRLLRRVPDGVPSTCSSARRRGAARQPARRPASRSCGLTACDNMLEAVSALEFGGPVHAFVHGGASSVRPSAATCWSSARSRASAVGLRLLRRTHRRGGARTRRVEPLAEQDVAVASGDVSCRPWPGRASERRSTGRRPRSKGGNLVALAGDANGEWAERCRPC
jgi:hypothetical protein